MDWGLMTALRLSQEWHCTPLTVLETPADLVLAAMEYVDFKSDYEETFAELNKPKT